MRLSEHDLDVIERVRAALALPTMEEQRAALFALSNEEGQP